jgi:putative intracellular protease/amidase
MTDAPFRMVFAVYTGMTQLDFTGPYQFMLRMPHSESIVASSRGGAVHSDGLVFADTQRLAEISACDLICVPGGAASTRMALDPEYLDQVKRLASGARYITSVCTGSLILGAAGLLQGKRATCHWAYRDLLPLFGAIADDRRVVRDGNVITGGGVTAGIDFALTVLAEVAGAAVAQEVQLGLEYAPAPPFDCGTPDSASDELIASYRAKMASLAAARRLEAEQSAARLAACRT